MLPQTGADGGAWIALVAAAAVVIVLGGLLLRRGISRRALGTGVAALALVGVVALGAGGAAPSAFADAGSSTDCVHPTAPAPTAAPSPSASTEPTAQPAIVVTPAAPTAAAQCGAEPLVAIPSQEGVSYAQTRSGDVLTVTATALPGYAIAAGAQTVFELDVAATERLDPPVAVPAEVDGILLGEQNGVITVRAADQALIPALEAAAADGALSYTISTTGRISYGYVLELDGQEIESGTISGGLPSTVAYVDGSYAFTYDVADLPALNAEVNAQRDALLAEHPGASFRTVGQFPDLGIRLTTSYEPGPGCETAVTESPVVLGFPPAVRLAPTAAQPDGLLSATSDSLR
ncbi:LPXTG cell wall anchor domain-containing protein [Agrococcus sp. SGAir0287]|uniref:LPXTG cell wall anchor domain-containing protein n=1 Tax=Agrococcus sp. SGAir0287 TaxID=2070347 RepID=UPI00158663B3|nr:LPXTG cell wall anchor domain-containing protein [Agrococcus sp. SGAir0287]